MVDLIAQLEEWAYGDKSRSYRIDRDDGFGAAPCIITLTDGDARRVTVERCDDDGEWEGLAGTLQRALRDVK